MKEIALSEEAYLNCEGDDDITSLAETELGVDRTTQKRRYSRLSDGYERLKSVLPTVKDKRRVSKARILDEAINYIQRLESITSVLKREHEKRLSMLNGSNGFFPDYSMQPYMRSIFQKQMYPSSSNGSAGKMASVASNYSKLNSPSSSSSMSKSPRMKQQQQQQQQQQQYNHQQSYSAQSPMSSQQQMTGPNLGVAAAVAGGGGSSGSLDYSYNNIGGYGASSMYSQQSNGAGADPTNHMMSGSAGGTGVAESSPPLNNTSPYSSCSLSPGSGTTSTSYQQQQQQHQNGASNSVVNNSWPYQGLSYNEAPSYLTQNRHSPASNAQYNGSSSVLAGGGGNPYSSLSSSMWGSMSATASNGGLSDSSTHVGQHAASTIDHTMKVG